MLDESILRLPWWSHMRPLSHNHRRRNPFSSYIFDTSHSFHGQYE